MNKNILITGANGFIGGNCASYFQQAGHNVWGIGHGECAFLPIDRWVNSSVTQKMLVNMKQSFDVIVHCAGSGSVNFSIQNTHLDYDKNVSATREVLEYIRLNNPQAKLIFPSSPAVLGELPNQPVDEEYSGIPISPYGEHKKIAEDMCFKYSHEYGLGINILRMFSVYGVNLKKQLFWDACGKLSRAEDKVTFWGTGDETRDFVHINDVLSLINRLIQKNHSFLVVNCGSGISYTISDTIELLKNILQSQTQILFNNQVNIGNPKHYWANISKARQLGWEPRISLKQGLREYVQWIKTIYK